MSLCMRLSVRGVLGLSDFNRSHVFSPTSQSVFRLGAALCGFLRVRDAVLHEAGPLADALHQTQIAAAKADDDVTQPNINTHPKPTLPTSIYLYMYYLYIYIYISIIYLYLYYLLSIYLSLSLYIYILYLFYLLT